MKPAAILAGALLSVGVWPAGAQEGTPPQENTGGTVFKGRAPVATELLRIRFPKPKEYRLGNGVRVFVLEDHRLPLVRLSLRMKAGTLFEPRPGVAQFTADMLDEGTTTRDFRQLADAQESIGVQIGAAAGAERTIVSGSGLSEYTDRVVDLMADVIRNPAFPQDRLDRLKFRGTSGLAQRRTNPTSMAGEVLSRTLYGTTPYGRVPATAEQIRAISREDLVAFHRGFYRPNGAILGVSGDVEPKEIVRKLEEAFAGWTPAPAEPALPAADLRPKEATRIYLVDRPGSAQTVLQFANLAISRTDPDYIPLVVANRVLGGGSSARLFQNIREQKGYTYGAYSSLSTPRWRGTWGASASVRTPVTTPAVGEFFKEFRRIQEEPVPQEELERAKRSIVGSFARTLESPEGILDRALELVENGLPPDYWDTYPEKIQAVTPHDVQRVARQYLGENRIQLIAVGERKQIEDGLKQYGPVEVVVPPSQSGGGRRGG
jgi:zinc protease